MPVSEFSVSENISNVPSNFDDGFVRREFYKSLNGQLNPSFFGADSIEQIFAREHERRFLVDRPKSFRNTRRRKRDGALYAGLDPGINKCTVYCRLSCTRIRIQIGPVFRIRIRIHGFVSDMGHNPGSGSKFSVFGSIILMLWVIF